MKDPRITAAISLIGLVLIGLSIFFSQEAPSPMLAILQWALLGGAFLGLVGSLFQIGQNRR
ncbi:MAG: hypothetical protein ABI398_10760 [Devosia sp.]